MASEIIAWHASRDPDHCTDAGRAALLGRNWCVATKLLHLAYDLTPEQAHRIADHHRNPDEEDDYEAACHELPGTGLYDWNATLFAVEAVVERGWRLNGPCWVAYDAFLDALVATNAGDRIPERLRDQLMGAWRTEF